MGQISWAIEDVSTGQWTPTPIYNRINEVVPDAADVSSQDGVELDTFEVKLQGLAWPEERGAGTHTLTVQLKRTGPSPGYAVIMLLQGGKLIAGQEVQAGTSFANATIELTADQVALIDDYSDLRLRVVAGRSLVDCCEEPVSALLTATRTAAGGDCSCLPESFQLNRPSPIADWLANNSVPLPGCEHPVGFLPVLRCAGTTWILFGSASTCDFTATLDEETCSPFSQTWTLTFADTCCTGSATYVFTE